MAGNAQNMVFFQVASRWLAALALFGLGFGTIIAPLPAMSQGAEIGEETWRYNELERMLYQEEADARLNGAIAEMSTMFEVAERNFRLSGATRLTQYNCPSANTLAVLDEHIDANVTTARLYRKYGHYFLCIRQYDEAISALSAAIPLFQKGFGREALIERSDPTYLAEVRNYYDTMLFETMQLMEATGAQQSYARAQAMTDEYWPKRFDSADAVLVMRGDVIDAWEEAMQLADIVGMSREAEEARQMLRTVLTFDQNGTPRTRTAR